MIEAWQLGLLKYPAVVLTTVTWFTDC
ncbi:hypothetical protein MYA98_12080 [Salmonella sp. WGH-01]|nr:hypothetical protein MYA98_12080 [Salmonella sp. WGH-01]